MCKETSPVQSKTDEHQPQESRALAEADHAQHSHKLKRGKLRLCADTKDDRFGVTCWVTLALWRQLDGYVCDFDCACGMFSLPNQIAWCNAAVNLQSFRYRAVHRFSHLTRF